MSLTGQLAEVITSTRPEDVPAGVQQAAQGFVLDWLGCAIAGAQTTPGEILLWYARRHVGQGATVLGAGDQASPATAALVNGGLSHIVEMDDLHRGSVVHPGTVIIPAALATAERVGRSGPAFLTAVVVGYEVAIRIGEAVGKEHYFYWHNTATCGVYGAAAAAGWLLGLNAEQLTWALGNAGTQACGLWQFLADGAMTKHLHAGRAANAGVLAAELAALGFTGPTEILEGPKGFFAATAPDAEPARVIRNLQRPMPAWKLPGTSIKPHASCRHTHPPIDAALALRQELTPELDDIAEVEVDTYRAALDLTDNPQPAHEYAAKFSLQYTVACALARGHVGLTDFTPETLTDPDIRRLAARVRVRHSEAIEGRYPAAWPARVTLRLRSGQQFSHTVEHPKGDPENPVTRDELAGKFRMMVADTPWASQADRAIAAAFHLTEAAGVSDLTAHLRPE
jgi:2-methylcitrate dehydratase PrpD